MKAFYDLFLFFYPLGARLLSARNDKAGKWWKGRQGIFERLASAVATDKPLIWVHCSSLGEFEQGRPLIERLRQDFPDSRILLTFFSPSGYEVQKQYARVDYVFYLPMDSRSNAQRFFDIVQPSLVVFVKYEFWYYYITEAKRRNIPFVLVSAVFRKDQPFFQWYGGFHRRMLNAFSFLFVQDEESANLLRQAGISHFAVTGDTRFDRVLAIAQDTSPVESVDRFCGDNPVIVAGSTWVEDDKELAHYARSNTQLRFIVAPHDVSQARIDECKSLYVNAFTYSQYKETGVADGNVMIIDCIGLLSRLYRYCSIAFVGGGFGADGVHNVLEAAVYGKPVVFGPVYDKYVEVAQLVAAGGGFPVATALELEKQMDILLQDAMMYSRASAASQSLVAAKAGATEKILAYIQEKRLFTT